MYQSISIPTLISVVQDGEMKSVMSIVTDYRWASAAHTQLACPPRWAGTSSPCTTDEHQQQALPPRRRQSPS
jgi:hypothetical protein